MQLSVCDRLAHALRHDARTIAPKAYFSQTLQLRDRSGFPAAGKCLLAADGLPRLCDVINGIDTRDWQVLLLFQRHTDTLQSVRRSGYNAMVQLSSAAAWNTCNANAKWHGRFRNWALQSRHSPFAAYLPLALSSGIELTSCKIASSALQRQSRYQPGCKCVLAAELSTPPPRCRPMLRWLQHHFSICIAGYSSMEQSHALIWQHGCPALALLDVIVAAAAWFPQLILTPCLPVQEAAAQPSRHARSRTSREPRRGRHQQSVRTPRRSCRRRP